MRLRSGRRKKRTEVLFSAARNGHESCIHPLVFQGADVNYRNKSRETALGVAVKAEKVECVYRLIQAGATWDQTEEVRDLVLKLVAKV